jgi:histone chaperone ASF1
LASSKCLGVGLVKHPSISPSVDHLVAATAQILTPLFPDTSLHPTPTLLPPPPQWKVTYVGSAEDSSKDQILDEVMVGPVPVGTNKFVLQADPPDPTTIGEADILGVTVVLVTCSYKEQEFCRVGYYVNNEYSEPFDEEQGVPTPLDITKVTRQILADKVRSSKWNIRSSPLLLTSFASPPPPSASSNPFPHRLGQEGGCRSRRAGRCWHGQLRHDAVPGPQHEQHHPLHLQHHTGG